jgi:hypothetical protein
MRRTLLHLIVVALPVSIGAFYLAVIRPARPTDPVLVGAGNIADCQTSQDAATAKLLDRIDGTVFTVGDQVAAGGSGQYRDCYASAWGRHQTRTRPAPGTSDYAASGGAPYYDYFGANAGPAGLGYYGYDLGTWHIVALNSEIAADAASPQAQWLRSDLAAHPSSCTLAYWHRPLFSSGAQGSDPHMQAIWQILYQAGADVVLSGRDHNYERFAPQDPGGQADPRGIREFVVGTGGQALREIGAIRPNSEARGVASGVLKLTLHISSYHWEFVPIDGAAFHDSGFAGCVREAPSPTATGALAKNAPAPPAATPMQAVQAAAGTIVGPMAARPDAAFVPNAEPSAIVPADLPLAATPTALPTGAFTTTYSPRVDTYVSLNYPDTSYGASSQLLAIGGWDEKRSFLSFTVAGLPADAQITSAKLVLTVINDSSSGGLFYMLSSSNWSELMTWQNQPAIGGAPLAELGPVKLNQVITIDVGAIVKGNGEYNFAIIADPTNGNAVGYASQQNAAEALRPRLIVGAWRGEASPTVPSATPEPTPTAVLLPLDLGRLTKRQ